MKRLLCLLLAALLLCFNGAFAEGNSIANSEVYPDGIYRGFYYDGGIEQIAIQFELKNGVFDSIVYRGVKYKDGDYLSDDASDVQKAILRQYRQLADYLLGKGVNAIEALYSPYDIVEDADAVTTATIQSSKLISALWDALNRRPYKLVDTSKLPLVSSFADGVYRGSYMEDGAEQVAVEFTIRDGVFQSITYRALSYKDVDYLSEAAPEAVRTITAQFQELIDYLEGKPISAVNDLYLPGGITADAVSGATLRSPKVISAIWDGFNRRAYRLE